MSGLPWSSCVWLGRHDCGVEFEGSTWRTRRGIQRIWLLGSHMFCDSMDNLLKLRRWVRPYRYLVRSWVIPTPSTKVWVLMFFSAQPLSCL